MLFREEVHILAVVWRLTHHLMVFYAPLCASALEGITSNGLLRTETLYNQPGLL